MTTCKLGYNNWADFSLFQKSIESNPTTERFTINQPDITYKNNIDQDPFWLENPRILLRRDKLTEFYPEHSLSINEQLNAITRFIIYFGLILFILSGQLSSLFLILIGILMVIFISQHGKHFLSKSRETFISNYRNDNQLPCDYPIDITSNGKVYQPPTPNNPLMNVLMSDYMSNPNRPPAGNLDDPQIRQQVDNLLQNNLPVDGDDVWNKRNGQREFMTQPNTQIPNDQGGFARWCFNTSNHSCRENYICKNDLAWNNNS